MLTITRDVNQPDFVVSTNWNVSWFPGVKNDCRLIFRPATTPNWISVQAFHMKIFLQIHVIVVPLFHYFDSFERAAASGNQMLFPTDTQGYPGQIAMQFHHTHPPTSQPQLSANQKPHKQSGGHDRSSSSCSSQSSASSASSSSGSSASSGARLGRNRKATNVNGNATGLNQHTSCTSSTADHLTSSGPMQSRNGAPSVQSASGKSYGFSLQVLFTNGEFRYHKNTNCGCPIPTIILFRLFVGLLILLNSSEN